MHTTKTRELYMNDGGIHHSFACIVDHLHLSHHIGSYLRIEDPGHTKTQKLRTDQEKCWQTFF